MDGRLIIHNDRIETAEKLVSENPATLEAVGEVSLASGALCEQAIRAAKEAFPGWRWLEPRKKREILKRAEEILARRASEAGRLIAMEKGSPYPEALAGEVFGALQSLNYYGENQGRLLRPERAGHHTPLFFNKTGTFHFHPLGPTLIISPWNFPFLIPFCDILSSLTAGNTVVLRPSTTTPLTALLIGEIFVEAGLPPGVLNVVPCRVPQAEAMIVDRDIQTVMFTGSVGIGKRVMELCSRNLTNMTLELGGKDPMIVLKDADLERAARGAVWTAFMNCGQSCGSIERAYVAREVADAFIARVVELAGQVRVGNPLDSGVDMGPMATAGQLKVVEEHIADARGKGARIPVGGKRVAGLPGHFIEPTVLTGVDHTMLVMTEETFGPTLPIMVFDHPDEAVALANDSVYGLTASVWTRDRKQAAWFAERLEAGSVTVNDHMYS
ncbi:MAG: aldehyde dehydrogenase family protein, partial [Acidobacteria bacterium]|nr:aldehyde dehydrogenase family protein [Acidobacteriota bacterium]